MSKCPYCNNKLEVIDVTPESIDILGCSDCDYDTDYSKRQLETGGVYTIKSIDSGNYDSFITLVGFPDTFYHADTSRQTTKNVYNLKHFELV